MINMVKEKCSMSKVYDEYIKFLDDTSWYIDHDEGSMSELCYLTLGLAGEAGEFADEVKKLAREIGTAAPKNNFISAMTPERKSKLVAELGDVQWYLAKLIAFFNLDQDLLMVLNVYKLYNRQSTRAHYPTTKWPFTASCYSYEAMRQKVDGVPSTAR